jgi:flagellar biogenesis protein FliO
MAENENSANNVSIEDLKKIIIEKKQAITKDQKVNNYLTFAIILVLLIFIFLMYKKMESNFTSDKILKSVETAAPQVLPAASEKLVEVATDVYPVYYQTFTKESIEALPAIAMKIDSELAIMTKELTDKTKEEVSGVLQRILEKQDANFKTAYPDLTEEDLKTLNEKITKDIQIDFEEISMHLMTNSLKQVGELKKTAEKFITPDLPNNEAKLSKLFVHYMLQLIDQEIMGGK